MAASKVVDMTVEEFSTAIAKALGGKTSGFSSGPSFAQGDEGGIKALVKQFGSGLTGILSHMSTFAGRAIDQSADTGDAVQMVSKTMSEVLPESFGILFGKLGGFVADSVRDWQQVSSLGFQMGGDAMAFRQAFSSTGMSVKDWAGMLDTTKPAFAMLTGNLSTGAQAFGQMSFEIQNSTDSQAFLKLGMGAKDMNEALAVTIASQGVQRLQGQSQQERMQTFLDSTVKLSKEMDEQAKLTGMSRQEQLKNINEIQKEVQYRAAVLQFRQKNPEAEKVLGDVNKASVGMGQEMQRALVMSLARNGAITQEMANDIQRTYGPAVLAQVVEIGRMGNSSNAEIRAQALTATEGLQKTMGAGLQQMSHLHNYGVASNTKMAQEAYTQQYNRETSIAAYRNADASRAKMTNDEIYAIIKDDIRLQQEGRRTQDEVDKDGKLVVGGYNRGDKDPTTLATDLTMEAQRQITLFGANLNRVVDTMNLKLTGNADVVKAGGEALNAMRQTGTTADSNMQQSPVTALTSKILLKFDTFNTEAENSQLRIAAKWDEVLKRIETLFGNVTKKADGTNPSKSGNGSWFQGGPQLSMWAEAGPEAIVNEADASKFIMDNIGLVSNAGVNSPTMNSLLRNIPAQISSVKETVSAQVEQAINSTTDQSELVSALREISTVMQVTASTMREVARNTKDTATNIKAAGINIV
jgi:hypothetical protein